MAILMGIDEAGYGPLLGPMVVSAVALNIPESHLRADLWHVLSAAVSAQKKDLAGRLLITDSKKAYTRSSGVKHLRRTVLSSLHAWSKGQTNITTVYDMLSTICPDIIERAAAYPWYQNLNTFQLDHDPADVEIASSVFRKKMAENGISISRIQSRCLDVDLYNSRVEQVKNKSRVLFTELCSLILEAFEQLPADSEPMHVVVDRQGGRIKYQRELMRMFNGFSLSVIRQDEKMSSYELTRSGKTMWIHFCLKADTKYLTVSLASMVSKYLREVMMESLNDYFCRFSQDLKPTAGYWQDGKRFIADLGKLTPDLTYDPKQLIRIS